MKAVILLATAASLFAQPQIGNANVQTTTFSGSLKAVLAAKGSGPYWAAWQEPIVSGRRGDMCSWNGNNNAPIRLEGPVALLVLVRMDNSQVDQLRVSSPDCRFDGGGLAFHWITGVPAAESVAWLQSQVSEKNPDRAILAISLHAGQAAEQALDQLFAPTQPRKVREQVLFALSQSKDPAALAMLIDAAKNDKTPQIRSKALFWLAQKAASKQTQDVILSATRDDPDRSVKEQAVFALKQLPGDQGVPLLIEVAKNNPDLAVRKKAMFWLGQSKDPRATDFFARVLTER